MASLQTGPRISGIDVDVRGVDRQVRHLAVGLGQRDAGGDLSQAVRESARRELTGPRWP
jgi:hypothetical protein